MGTDRPFEYANTKPQNWREKCKSDSKKQGLQEPDRLVTSKNNTQEARRLQMKEEYRDAEKRFYQQAKKQGKVIDPIRPKLCRYCQCVLPPRKKVVCNDQKCRDSYNAEKQRRSRAKKKRKLANQGSS